MSSFPSFHPFFFSFYLVFLFLSPFFVSFCFSIPQNPFPLNISLVLNSDAIKVLISSAYKSFQTSFLQTEYNGWEAVFLSFWTEVFCSLKININNNWSTHPQRERDETTNLAMAWIDYKKAYMVQLDDKLSQNV